MSYAKPYAGVKVLDLSQGIAGPYASALLSQQGADVIKVEPQRGDWMRPKGRDGPFGDMTPSFVIANLGKRSIVVDLKTTQGVAIVCQLAAEADIFMEGFRPGVIERLGLGYKVVADLNPRVIYLSVSGFGQEGPLRERPATDGVLQAFSGFMSVNRGPDNIPHRAGVPIIDLATSLYNLQAMQAALWARQSAGEGCHIDNSLLRGAASFYNMSLASEHLLGSERPLGIYPTGIFATTDGFINVICLHDHNFPVCATSSAWPSSAITRTTRRWCSARSGAARWSRSSARPSPSSRPTLGASACQPRGCCTSASTRTAISWPIRIPPTAVR